MELFLGTPKGSVVTDLLEKERCATSILTIAELSDKCEREKQVFEPYLEFIQRKAALIPITIEIAQQAGRLKNELRQHSKNISLADSIHFQTAKSMGAAFVTGDPDFKEVKGILFL